MQFYEFAHNLGVHVWVIPSLVVMPVMGIMGIVHWRNQKKRDSDFEDELNEKIQEIREALAETEEGGV